MEKKQFRFSATILGERKELVVNVPVRNGFVITNEFCPKVLTGLTPANGSFLADMCETIQGELISEFQADCNFLVSAMEECHADSRLDVHLYALQNIVESHLRRCGRLIYNDMLIYVDCFALLLKADGFSTSMINDAYPVIVYNLVEACGQFVKDQFTLQPFKGTLLYRNLLEYLQNNK